LHWPRSKFGFCDFGLLAAPDAPLDDWTSMLFNEAFVESIAQSAILTVIEICTRLHDSMRDDGSDLSTEEIENVTETFSLLRAIEEAGIIHFDKAVPDISGTPADDSIAMMYYINSIRDSLAGQAKTLQVYHIKMRFSNSSKPDSVTSSLLVT
jgi:hypothetical protein